MNRTFRTMGQTVSMNEVLAMGETMLDLLESRHGDSAQLRNLRDKPHIYFAHGRIVTVAAKHGLSTEQLLLLFSNPTVAYQYADAHAVGNREGQREQHGISTTATGRYVPVATFAADPVNRFHEQVRQAFRANGGDSGKAIASVVKNDPQLHADYLAANRASNVPATLTTPVFPSNAVAQFDAAVAAKMATGMNRGQAIAKVVQEQPVLHRAYLNAVNGRN